MLTIIYDFETSGLNPYHDDIIEIGSHCIDTNESFECLVQPMSDKCISLEIENITGISNRLLKKEGLRPIEAFKRFFDFLNTIFISQNEDIPITMIAHNGSNFDDIFFRKMYHTLVSEGISDYDNLFKNINYIDTLNLSRLLHPERRSHSMKSMCMVYNILNLNEHRAMGDVNALVKLWNELQKKIMSKYKQIDTNYINNLLFVRV